ncbi:hypothetical protein GW17_00001240 [Ensete ventricosum]|nr:hypothetical protein GW17_00001240 [Ensete ventricosum]
MEAVVGVDGEEAQQWAKKWQRRRGDRLRLHREAGAGDDNRGGAVEEEGGSRDRSRGGWSGRQQRCGRHRNNGERIAIAGSCGCGSGLEMAASGRRRRGVGTGTGYRWEKKEEGNDEGPMSAVVSSGPVVSSCRKQRLSTTAWLQAAALATNDDSYRLAEEEEGNEKQGKQRAGVRRPLAVHGRGLGGGSEVAAEIDSGIAARMSRNVALIPIDRNPYGSIAALISDHRNPKGFYRRGRGKRGINDRFEGIEPP